MELKFKTVFGCYTGIETKAFMAVIKIDFYGK